jgi:hypothetical protein
MQPGGDGVEVGVVRTVIPAGGAGAAGEAFQYDSLARTQEPGDGAVDNDPTLPGRDGIGHRRVNAASRDLPPSRRINSAANRHI